MFSTFKNARVGVMPVCLWGGIGDGPTNDKVVGKKDNPDTSPLSPAAMLLKWSRGGCSGKYINWTSNTRQATAAIIIRRLLLLSGGIKLFHFDSMCKGYIRIRDNFFLIPETREAAAQHSIHGRRWMQSMDTYYPSPPQSTVSTIYVCISIHPLQIIAVCV